jgi:hypothetical protein
MKTEYLNDLQFAARRVLELSAYIDEIAECPRRSCERKAEIIESAYALKRWWAANYRELKYGKERTH